ncbi:hypothetical protein N5D61_24745 [Pseudomonas sp. GD03842]|uniref:hypothetical protein n=1 Tax=Pseudomonas sp. GD03842 TaxID=2975385 RepID=UPI002446A6FD|nr:hypothetical protein [Pseudomonas sp. GD03842]MDH0749538.1 hypothetical protein [Pseudomonas sp. GD03842]
MSFGLQFINTSNVVTLDSEFARLSVLCSGRYLPNSESGVASITSFPFTITSQEPPLVFVRPDTVNAQAGLGLCKIYGQPGAWTGFYVRTVGNGYAPPNGSWFAAAFMAKPTASFGLRLWDGGSNLIFDSGTPAAVFTRAYQNWSYVGSDSLAANIRNFYSVPFSSAPNEYMLINNFSMNMVSGNQPGRQLWTIWDFPNSILYAMTVATSNPNAFYLPALFAKMTV